MKLWFKARKVIFFCFLLFFNCLLFSQENNITAAETNKEKKVYLKANKISLSKDKKIIIAYDNVLVFYKKGIIKAEKIKYNWEDKIIYAQGKVEYKDEEKIFFGEYFNYNLDKDEGICPEGGIKVFAESLYCKGEPIKRISKDQLYIEKGSFTTCELNNPHYWFKGEKIMIFPHNKLIAKKIRMYILGCPLPPVFFLPFYTRSLKKKPTGLEFNYGYEKYKGFFFRNEYKYDFKDILYSSIWLEFTSQLDICFGSQVKGDYNFTIQKGKGNFEAAYNEEGRKNLYTEEINKYKTWRFEWFHQQRLPFNINNSCEVSLANQSCFYEENIRNYEKLLKNELKTTIHFNKNLEGQYINLDLVRNFNIKNEEEIIYLPKINYNKYYKDFFLPKFLKNLSPKICYNINSDFINYYKYKNYDRENKYYKIKEKEMAADVEFGLKLARRLFNWLNVIPNVKIEEVYYNKSENKKDPVWFYKLKSQIQLNTIFFKIFNFQFFNLFKGLRHEIFPTITYSNSLRQEFQETFSLYPLPGISRYDVFPFTEEITINLKNNLQVKQLQIDMDDTGKEVKRSWTKKLDLINLNNNCGYKYNYSLNTYELTPLLSQFSFKPLNTNKKYFSGNFIKETNAYMDFIFTSTYFFEKNRLQKDRINFSYIYDKKIYKKKEPEIKNYNKEENLLFSLYGCLSFVRNFTDTKYTDFFTLIPLKITLGIFKNWNFSYATAFNFESDDKELFRFHSFDVTKLLHCWELNMKLYVFKEIVDFKAMLKIRKLESIMIQWHETVSKSK